jgi:pimeloyl-ACP methyl ester carboxylesterase
MSERALLFGRTGSLVGIVTDPGPRERRDGLPGVVILNAGVLHRVGPNRVHVQLARALARAGFVVLRFDLSGIGDSRPRPGGEAFATAVLREVGESLDLLEATRGLRRFLVVGICSGADNGLRAAHADQRVVGAVLVDGYNLPSLAHTLHLNRRRLLSAWSWLRLLLGRSEVWSDIRRSLAPARADQTTHTRYESILPPPGEYVAQVRGLAARGARLLLVYTSRSPAQFNYRRLLSRRIASWPGRENVSVEHFGDSDHTFTLLRNQQELVRLVCRWATELGPR